MMHATHRFASAESTNVKRFLMKSFLQNFAGQNGAVVRIPAATICMIPTHGEKFPWVEPWPYEKKRFRLWHDLLDFTTSRFTENTKIITVDGNVGVGKLEFAKRLAKEFDLQVLPSTPESSLFKLEDRGLDMRKFDILLPEFARHYDYKAWLQDPHPEKGLGGKLQYDWYFQRFQDYRRALVHLLNTGQGVVVVRSPFTDIVYAKALCSLGWFSKPGYDFYYETWNDTSETLFNPHLCIYLDASVDVCKERLKKKNNPMYANARNLTDGYLKAIETAYKEDVLPNLRIHSEVVEIDWNEVADDLDMDAIAVELSHLKLEPEDNEDRKFKDWTHTEENFSAYRRAFDKINFSAAYFSRDTPWEAPELLDSDDKVEVFQERVFNHPAVYYKPGWAPEFEKSLWKRYMRLW